MTAPTPAQTWTDGQAVALVLPSNTFTDALGLTMTFTAYEMSGPKVTSWLHFNPTTDELFGTIPIAATGAAQLAVFATDSLHMTAVDLFTVTLALASGYGGFAARPGSLDMLVQYAPSQPAGLFALHTRWRGRCCARAFGGACAILLRAHVVATNDEPRRHYVGLRYLAESC